VTLAETLATFGMTPPRHFPIGRFVRFPGAGKGQGNKAGWAKLFTPDVAVWGDFSSGQGEANVWTSDRHVDPAEAARVLREAREQMRRAAQATRRDQEKVARAASQLIAGSKLSSHAYLVKKGFPDLRALVSGTNLIVPMRDVADYSRVLSVQTISEAGEKLFLRGGRTAGAVFRMGATEKAADRSVLCEGYATGLTLIEALQRLRGRPTVIVCFSAANLERVAKHFPGAFVAADNDHPNKLTGVKAGEAAAIATGLKWSMPPTIGTDFNDMHQSEGIHAVVEVLRTAF